MNSVFWPDPSKINPKTPYDFPKIVLAEQAGSIFGSKFETVTEHGGSKNDPNLKIENLGISKHNMHKNHFWSDFFVFRYVILTNLSCCNGFEAEMYFH